MQSYLQNACIQTTLQYDVALTLTRVQSALILGKAAPFTTEQLPKGIT